MITVVNKGRDEAIVKLRGLAADVSDAPTDVPNGSELFTMDDGKTYYFDAESGEWVDPTAE